MSTMTSPINAESAIRERIDSWVAAILAKDLDTLMAHYAPDVVTFDAISALQFKGIDAYREHWAACLEFCPGTMQFTLHEVQIRASGDIAFSHALSHCGGTNDQGEEQACWMRGTTAYQQRAGEWLIVHEHFSAPFDMQSGKALCDLQP